MSYRNAREVPIRISSYRLKLFLKDQTSSFSNLLLCTIHILNLFHIIYINSEWIKLNSFIRLPKKHSNQTLSRKIHIVRTLPTLRPINESNRRPRFAGHLLSWPISGTKERRKVYQKRQKWMGKRVSDTWHEAKSKAASTQLKEKIWDDQSPLSLSVAVTQFSV